MCVNGECLDEESPDRKHKLLIRKAGGLAGKEREVRNISKPRLITPSSTHYYTMEKSCINDTSSSKSTAAEHLNGQPTQ